MNALNILMFALLKVRNAVEDDAALPRILVMRVKGIVMDQEMVVVMMDIKAVREILFVEAITASNLEPSTMKRMIVVKDHIRNY